MNIKNSWMGVGRITNDPEVKITESGKHVCNFSVAINDGTKENPHTTFVPVDAWEGFADTIAKYFHKGDQIMVGGRLSVRKYDDRGETRNKMTVVLESFEWGEKKKEKAEETYQPAEPVSAKQDFYPSDITDFGNEPWVV